MGKDWTFQLFFLLFIIELLFFCSGGVDFESVIIITMITGVFTATFGLMFATYNFEEDDNKKISKRFLIFVSAFLITPLVIVLVDKSIHVSKYVGLRKVPVAIMVFTAYQTTYYIIENLLNKTPSTKRKIKDFFKTIKGRAKRSAKLVALGAVSLFCLMSIMGTSYYTYIVTATIASLFAKYLFYLCEALVILVILHTWGRVTADFRAWLETPAPQKKRKKRK